MSLLFSRNVTLMWVQSKYWSCACCCVTFTIQQMSRFFRHENLWAFAFSEFWCFVCFCFVFYFVLFLFIYLLLLLLLLFYFLFCCCFVCLFLKTAYSNIFWKWTLVKWVYTVLFPTKYSIQGEKSQICISFVSNYRKQCLCYFFLMIYLFIYLLFGNHIFYFPRGFSLISPKLHMSLHT